MNIEKFKMLDQILEIDTERGIILSQTCISESSPVWDAHFPGHPIVPGVLLIEVMAQSAGHLAMAISGFSAMAILTKVVNCKFLRPVLPGDQLSCQVKITASCGSMTTNKIEIRRDGILISSAELQMKVIDFPTRASKELFIRDHQAMSIHPCCELVV